jgi:hypothetical protein
MNVLLKEFIMLECNAHTVDLVNSAIADSGTRYHCFNFNIFDVTIDVENELVFLENILDPTPSGEEHIRLSDFITAIRQTRS